MSLITSPVGPVISRAVGSPFARHTSVPGIIKQGTAWWRGDRLITLNGSTVSAWGDLTGNGNTATQATEAAQPTYAASAIGGKPALQSDGNDGFLAPTGLWSAGAMTTMFVAHLVADGGLQRWFFQRQAASSVNTDMEIQLNSNRILLRIAGPSTVDSSQHSMALTTGDYLVIVRYDGSQSAANRVRISINGTSETITNDESSADDIGGLMVFPRFNSNQPPSGSEIIEAWTNNVAISDTDFASIENYALSRYGL